MKKEDRESGWLFRLSYLFLAVSAISLGIELFLPGGYTRSAGLIMSLWYGPGVYLCTAEYLKIKTNRILGLIHFLPFFFWGGSFFLMAGDHEFVFFSEKEFWILLYFSVFISGFIYSLYSINLLSQRNKTDSAGRMIKGIAIFVFLYSVVVIINMYRNFGLGKMIQEQFFLSVIGFLCKSLLVTGVFYYIIRRMFRIRQEKQPEEERNKGSYSVEIPDEFMKTTLPERLDEKLVRFENLLYHKKYFLNPDAGLDHIADQLKIPAYKITSFVNHIYQMGLPELLNRMRVRYACNLLIENPGKTMQSIAEASGFASETSFYRNFRIYQGVTPKQYKNRFCRK